MPLTDSLRAAVFARDKAICSFSGLSLWSLDHGMAPFALADWPDHIKPVSRGGKDTLANLACASHFYNGKKANNGGDVTYLFMNGAPTAEFFWTHGVLTQEQADTMRRNQAICARDWYFNRALFNLGVALENKFHKFDAVRDVQFWQSAALKKLDKWRTYPREKDDDFSARGLVRFPDAPDVRLMLQLTNASETTLKKIFKELFVHYSANSRLLQAFVATRDSEERRFLINEAARGSAATEPMLFALRTNIERMQ